VPPSVTLAGPAPGAGPHMAEADCIMRVHRIPRSLAALAGGALSLSLIAAGAAAASPSASAAPAAGAAAASAAPANSSTTCALGGEGKVKHVIYLQFDNVHYSRDNPNVPSDMEQMPNLLNFIQGNGTLISHEHTPLIAHTADDIVTSESGLYPSEQGLAVANEYQYYTGTRGQSSDTTDEAGGFSYWTDPIVDFNTDYAGDPVNDSNTNLIGQNGKTPPAPWVTYTRAGCNFGSVAAANTELENQAPDVAKVFGANSADATFANNSKNSNAAEAYYMGLSVHCAKGSAVCADNNPVPDVLPDEPGGYHGYQALFGALYIDKVLNPAGTPVPSQVPGRDIVPVTNLDGQVMQDFSGDIGFPGYDGMTGPNALAYTLDMQTHGVPVTFTYLTDLHDSFTGNGAFGPGEAGYESQLSQENAAFGTFFSDLAKAGITKQNTLFVVTADEGDHFVGSAPTPANCNGVTVTCNYSNIGEVDGNLTGMLAAKGVTTPFDVSADSAPIVYAHGQPSRTDSSVRTLEQTAATLTASDLATGQTVRAINYEADPVELKLLHMITGDPRRTPTVALFGNPDFWYSSGPANCGSSCFSQQAGGDAWNHGDVAPQINTTFLGLVGPGVRDEGVNNRLWSDHTDIAPTMWELLGLRADYVPDGRVLTEVIEPDALPRAVATDSQLIDELGQLYKQLNAPVGQFGLDTLKASTVALASTSSGDATYNKLEGDLAVLGSERDGVADAIHALLLGATLRGAPVNHLVAQWLLQAGGGILRQAASLPS
jgi:hypothetical protein